MKPIAPAQAKAFKKFIASVARCTKDGEEVDGQEFIMENDDAVNTLHDFIDQARKLLGIKTDA